MNSVWVRIFMTCPLCKGHKLEEGKCPRCHGAKQIGMYGTLEQAMAYLQERKEENAA